MPVPVPLQKLRMSAVLVSAMPVRHCEWREGSKKAHFPELLITGPSPSRHAWDTRQVRGGKHGRKACGVEQGLHALRLVVALFAEQPAARIQMSGRARDDGAESPQAIAAGSERSRGPLTTALAAADASKASQKLRRRNKLVREAAARSISISKRGGVPVQIQS